LKWVLEKECSLKNGIDGVARENWTKWLHKDMLTPSYLEELAKIVGYAIVFQKRNKTLAPDIPKEYRPDPKNGNDDAHIFADLVKSAGKKEFGKDKNQSSSFISSIKGKGLWSEGKPLRLHLGCGETYLNGYINVDYPLSEHNVMKIQPDVYADITKIELPENLVDEIRLHHVFEHFNRVTALSMLIKWQSSLKVGGLLYIETPDLIGCAKVLTSNVSFKTKMGITRHLAGDQAAHWAYHIDHWFAERYEHTLSAFGFDKIQIKNWSWEHEPYLANIEVKAVKSQVFSADRLLSIGESLLWDSTVADIEQPTYLIWVEQLRRAVRGEEIYDTTV
jgi:hypothetical protein